MSEVKIQKYEPKRENALYLFLNAINEIAKINNEPEMTVNEVFDYFCNMAKQGKGPVLYNDILDFAGENKIPLDREKFFKECFENSLSVKEKELLNILKQ